MGLFISEMISLTLAVFTILASVQQVSPAERATPRIAVVGAGIGGATTAHYLRQLFGKTASIDVYEKNQVGGRLATVHINNEDIESGGSIIHPANMYMVNFTKMLNLRVRDKNPGQMSLFDGEEILFETSRYSVVTMAKLLWRYGLSVVYLEDLVNLLLTDFSSIYTTQDAGHAFTTPGGLIASMSPTLHGMLGEPLRSYLEKRDFDEIFINELVTAGIQTNYGQTPDVHAFVGAVSLAGIQPGLWSVRGGNKQIVINLLEKSKSRMRKATVTMVTSQEEGHYTIASTDRNGNTPPSEDYDIVVIATPLEDEMSGIQFDNLKDDIVDKKLKFHRTVATFVNGRLKPGPFGFTSYGDITKAILLTNTSLNYKSFGRHESVAYRVSDASPDTQPGEGVWKVFSSSQLSSEVLEEFFTDVKEMKVVDWMAYPHFSSMTYGDALPQFELSPNLYYVNAFEWASSTMETQAIAGRNVALLAWNRWQGNTDKIDSQTQTGKNTDRDEL